MRKASSFCRLGVDFGLITLAVSSLLIGLSTPAYAYVDPSVMTYTIQAVAGVAVALSAVAGVVWRRIRRKAYAVLKIDPNRGKDVEASVSRLAPSDAETFSKEYKDRQATIQQSSHDTGKKRRIGYAALVAFFTVFTIFTVAPLEIVGGNASGFIFPLPVITPIIVVGSLILVVLHTAILCLIPRKAFRICALIVFSFGAYAYIQAMLLNGSLPSADGSTIIWSNYLPMMAISAVVLIAVIAIPLVVNYFNSDIAQKVCIGLCVALIVMQGAGVGSIFADYFNSEGSRSPKIYVTEQGLFDVSENSNVIVLVLDTIDNANFQTLWAENPDLLSGLNGFTVFSNPSGEMIPTACSIPFLLTGETPSAYSSIGEWRHDRYKNSSFIPTIADSDYSVGLYTDSLCLDHASAEVANNVASKVENVTTGEETKIDSINTLLALWKCALYRDMPWFLKAPFWFYTDEVNDMMVLQSADTSGQSTSYTMNDAAFYKKLSDRGLSLTNDGKKGAFRFIHLIGGHSPFNMGAHGEDLGLNQSNQTDQILGTFTIVNKYLDELKRLGVYDKSTIIITADHGTWHLTTELDFASVPILFAKPATVGSSQQELQVSPNPVDHADIQPTVLNVVTGQTNKYGADLFSAFPADRQRSFYWLTSDRKTNLDIVEYDITGDSSDFSNWSKTGRTWLWE